MNGERDLRQTICRETLSYLSEKARNLEHLILQTDGSTVGVQTADAIELNLLLAALPSLKKVVISTAFFTTSHVCALAHVQSLQSLTIHETGDEDQPYLDTTELQFHNAFPSLTHFSSETHGFKDVASFLDACQPCALRSISVSSPEVEDHEAFSCLFDIASSVCLGLKEIFLESVNRKITTTPQSSLLKESFRMLSGCLDLSSLTLHNAPPSLLNIETISDLLKGLPSLHTLSLSEYSGTEPILPLACLSKLAPLCPWMVKLGLYMDTLSVPDARSPHQNDSQCFKRLNHLNVGRSPLKSPALRVTAFLSSILPVGCNLFYTRNYSQSAGQCDTEFNTWASVADFLPMMIRMRKAERLLGSPCSMCHGVK